MTIYTTPEAFEDLTPSFGGALGSALGGGISSGLELLMEAKLKRMGEQEKLAQQRKKLDRLAAILGGRGRVQGEPTPGVVPGQVPEEISDEEILSLSGEYPNVAKILQSQKEGRAKITEARAKREFERAKPVLARADERAEEMPQKESALFLMKDAIKTGNLGFFSLNNLAKITGITGFRDPKGAQFISAGKEYFLGSLKRAGARPNQWIEQQIQKMLPMIGISEPANLTITEILENDLKVGRENLKILYRLVNEDEKKFGYIKGDIGQRVREELRKFANKEQEKLEVRLREIQKTEKAAPPLKKVSKGTPITIEVIENLRSQGFSIEGAKKRARQLGYEF